MALTDEEVQKSLDVLKALDQAIEGGPWDKSLLLKAIGKKLQDAREKFIEDLDLQEAIKQASAPQAGLNQQAILGEDFVEVYVSLYQAQGANIPKWAAILVSLTQLSITRPIYKNEEDMQASIRAKAFQANDAYVVVKIRKDDVLPAPGGKVPVDRFGRELMVLKENVIRPENITRFVHLTGEYRFVNGELIKK
jgi:intracellular multiplication protein IcmQ